MTIKAYISDKLRAFGVSEAQLVDMSISSGLSLDADVKDVDPRELGIALTHTVEECVLAPRMTNVGENGFSVSWNFDSVAKYYIWLCRKWGITPNDEVVAILGLSSIIDRTDSW